MIASDKLTNLDITEGVLKFFGIEKKLNQMLNLIGPRMIELRDQIYPTVKNVKAFQSRWRKVRSMLSPIQENALRDSHYIFLNKEQFKTLHDSSDTRTTTRFKRG